MKNKKIRILTALFAVVLCMAAFPLTAFAGGGEDSEAEPPAETAEQVQDPATVNPVTLTPEGNLTLVDDIDGEQAEDKQFITVVTKDGDYFYIIIDRAGSSQNVYFLNMVDDTDLFALIEDGDSIPAQTLTPEPEQPTALEPVEDEPEPEAEKSGGMGGILLVVLALAAGGGVFYYLKVLKPKQTVQGDTDLSELDELDFEGDDILSMGADEPEQEDEDE